MLGGRPLWEVSLQPETHRTRSLEINANDDCSRTPSDSTDGFLLCRIRIDKSLHKREEEGRLFAKV